MTDLCDSHPRILESICLKLDISRFGNWKDLGYQLGFSPVELQQFGIPYSCMKECLKVILKKRPTLTVGDMKNVLSSIDRKDVWNNLNFPGKLFGRQLFISSL